MTSPLSESAVCHTASRDKCLDVLHETAPSGTSSELVQLRSLPFSCMGLWQEPATESSSDQDILVKQPPSLSQNYISFYQT